MLGDLKLDSHSDIPLYRQLARHFTDLISSGELQAGERLPATRELAGQLGLNRTTVSAAYEVLEAGGLISGQVGRGSFVLPRPPADVAVNWDALLGPAPAPRPLAPSGPVISFATSRPYEHLFPLDAFRATCDEVLISPELKDILQLGSPLGYEPLRQHLLEGARREGVAGLNDDVIVTSGCQQALDLIRRVLIRPGDAVVVEDPVYPGLKNLFAETGANLAGVPVTSAGVDPDSFEAALGKSRPKLAVITPDFQNPTGISIPVDARRAILRSTSQAGAVLIENDIYGDLRYEGEAIPTGKRLDPDAGTVLLRSFSKIAFPGLRVGWIIGPRPLIARLTDAKQVSDLHTDQFSQAILLRFAQSGRLAAHRARMLESGGARLAAVLNACARYLPAGSTWTKPHGGMSLWATLPEPLDSSDLLPRSYKAGVAYLPGRYFAVSRSHANALRLSFAGLAPASIERGIEALGQVFSSELAARRALEREPAMAMV